MIVKGDSLLGSSPTRPNRPNKLTCWGRPRLLGACWGTSQQVISRIINTISLLVGSVGAYPGNLNHAPAKGHYAPGPGVRFCWATGT